MPAVLVPLRSAPQTYAEAVDRYLVSAGVARSSRRVYRIDLATCAWLLRGDQPPAPRRGAVPPDLPLPDLDAPRASIPLAVAFLERRGRVSADTYNRELAVLRGAVAWWRFQGWLSGDPTREVHRAPVVVDRTRALSHDEIERLWSLDVPLRDKSYWRLLYETAARASEALSLDVEDLDLANKRARVIGKGGDTEWIHWNAGSAQLLPRLLRGRARGPVFLTERSAPSSIPTVDICPVTGRARLSYRQAADLFKTATARIDPARHGWTLHQLRHSALTHESEEDGTSTPMLQARSRHASVRSLERYCRPSVDAVARHVAARDPAARRRPR